jgi:hypothetical protein
MSASLPPDEEEFDPYSEAPEPDVYWCLHCGRTYRPKQFRVVEGRELCPYEGCDGSVFADGMDWADIRRGHLDYPEIPEPGKVYVL